MKPRKVFYKTIGDQGDVQFLRDVIKNSLEDAEKTKREIEQLWKEIYKLRKKIEKELKPVLKKGEEYRKSLEKKIEKIRENPRKKIKDF